MTYHIPVLLQEVVHGLNVRPGGRYIDATLGDGGHTKMILDCGGTVLGIDQDPIALRRAAERLPHAIKEGTLKIKQGNFENLKSIATDEGFEGADGILMDLGMSKFQIAESERGFSFQRDEFLDMRMDPEKRVTAADLVNGLSEKELSELFTQLGQASHARMIARSIVRTRAREKIQTTGHLARLIEEIQPRRGKLHPATKVFMALRMAVNDELGALRVALPQAVETLGPNGRLAIISFHEGEDRIVKQFIKTSDSVNMVTKKPIMPMIEEERANPWARSARLRIAERKERSVL